MHRPQSFRGGHGVAAGVAVPAVAAVEPRVGRQRVSGQVDVDRAEPLRQRAGSAPTAAASACRSPGRSHSGSPGCTRRRTCPSVITSAPASCSAVIISVSSRSTRSASYVAGRRRCRRRPPAPDRGRRQRPAPAGSPGSRASRSPLTPRFRYASRTEPQCGGHPVGPLQVAVPLDRLAQPLGHAVAQYDEAAPRVTGEQFGALAGSQAIGIVVSFIPRSAGVRRVRGSASGRPSLDHGDRR